MSRVRVTKIFTFEAAHALEGYPGDCRYLHGHSYQLHVTLLGEVTVDKDMVIDFKELKSILKNNVIDPFDHSLILSNSHYSHIEEGRVIRLPFRPTAENLVIYFAGEISSVLPATVVLHSLRLYETDSSYAEWLATDNS